MFKKEANTRLYKRAINVLPGGVNIPVNIFNNIGIKPLYFKTGKGSKLINVSGKSYIDYYCSSGSIILGHANQIILKALVNQLKRGIGFGIASRNEIDMAELMIKMITDIQKIRFVNSDTEACMTAIKLARAYTGRNKIIKFEGCNHGYTETLLPSQGVADDKKMQSLPGIPSSYTREVLNAKYNNLGSVKALFHKFPKDIAAIIVEPVASNMGCVLPEKNFLEGLRSICNEYNTVFIFDETTTGFRLSRGGAQELLNIRADLIVYGKIIGGGSSIGAIAGKDQIMDLLAPIGPVFQSGSFAENPLTLTMGYSILKHLNNNPNIYKHLEEKTRQFVAGMKEIFSKKKIPATINQVGSMFSVFFTEKKVTNFNSAKLGDNDIIKSFHKHLIKNGILFPLSPYKTCFLTIAHSDRDIRRTLKVIKKWRGKI